MHKLNKTLFRQKDCDFSDARTALKLVQKLRKSERIISGKSVISLVTLTRRKPSEDDTSRNQCYRDAKGHKRKILILLKISYLDEKCLEV